MPFGPTRKSAGQRRHKVELQSATPTTDSMGGRTATTWNTYATTWAAIDPQPFVVSEQNATVLHIVSVPFRSDVEVRHRVYVPALNLRVKVLALVNPEHRNRDLILHCAEAADVQ